MFNKIALLLVALLIVMPLAAAQCPGGGGGITDEWGVITIPKGGTMKVGMSSAMAGDYAQYGNDMLHGCELAIADSGGAIKGFTTVAEPGDDNCGGAEATAVAEKFAADPAIVGVVGPMCSGGCVPASDVYGKNHLVMISPSCTAVAVTSRGYPTVFRVCPTDELQADFAVKFMTENLGIKKIAVTHDKSIYGQGVADAVKDKFEKAGGQVVAYEGLSRGDKDFSAVITKIKPTEPELVYFGGMDAEGALLVKWMRDGGMTALFMSDDGCYSVPTYIEASGGAAEGSYITFWKTEETSAYADWLARFEAKYGQKIAYAPQTYDATMILLAAVEKVAVVQGDGSLAIGKKALADAVRATNYTGILGTCSFTDKGDTTNAEVVLYKVEGGAFVEVK
ncbi:MAG: branched-chain amino acid ABC transporter substrate-binding protein [Chloroflexi bacterium]|nr:branched-chain amino acid ABC transporter substrate-binding protein [Chloroflexota bacterium]MBU1746389.1 branched-chain amino acid ABC transporter substrate-binding protein [Chloroflexota bacterium]